MKRFGCVNIEDAMKTTLQCKGSTGAVGGDRWAEGRAALQAAVVRLRWDPEILKL